MGGGVGSPIVLVIWKDYKELVKHLGLLMLPPSVHSGRFSEWKYADWLLDLFGYGKVNDIIPKWKNQSQRQCKMEAVKS
jgi:hypothetical protein